MSSPLSPPLVATLSVVCHLSVVTVPFFSLLDTLPAWCHLSAYSPRSRVVTSLYSHYSCSRAPLLYTTAAWCHLSLFPWSPYAFSLGLTLLPLLGVTSLLALHLRRRHLSPVVAVGVLALPALGASLLLSFSPRVVTSLFFPTVLSPLCFPWSPFLFSLFLVTLFCLRGVLLFSLWCHLSLFRGRPGCLCSPRLGVVFFGALFPLWGLGAPWCVPWVWCCWVPRVVVAFFALGDHPPWFGWLRGFCGVLGCVLLAWCSLLPTTPFWCCY